MPFDFDSVAAPFRMQPGLRRIAPGSLQLTPNRPGSAVLAEKLAALRDHPGDALLAAADFDAAPALRALLAQAVAEHPAALASAAPQHLEARALGWSVRAGEVTGTGPPAISECLQALPAAWRLAALLSLALAEDFAVIDGASARIPWLAVCLPSRWAPEDKVGRHFAEVHAPVADNQLLVTAADHLARLVTGPDRWERFVWTVSADPRLAQHPRHGTRREWPERVGADEIAACAVFRTEHQTFIPLPEARQAVFTIHVESRPLADAIDSAAKAARLRDALASMSPDVLAYRSLATVRAPLLAWLGERAA